MAKYTETPVTAPNSETSSFDGGTSGVEAREMTLNGPCVVSGVQDRCAEELVFVRSGAVDVFDGDGNIMEHEGNCFSIPCGQRYHLHVTTRGTARFLVLMIPASNDPDQIAAVQAIKAEYKDMLLGKAAS